MTRHAYTPRLSDFSDDNFDYDSSDSEYQKHRSRGPSRRGSMAAGPSAAKSQSSSSPYVAQQSPRSPQGAASRKPYEQYQNLRDEAADPFADDYDTPVQGNRRRECECLSVCLLRLPRAEGCRYSR